MLINRKKLGIKEALFFLVITLIYTKLFFSYLDVEPSYWGRIQGSFSNFTKYNFFNLPLNFSGKIDFVISPLLLLYIIANFKKLGRFKITVILVFILFLLNCITYSLTEYPTFIQSIQYTFKIASPVFLFIYVIDYFKNDNVQLKKLLIKTFKFCLTLSLFGVFIFDYVVRFEAVKLPIFFANIHSHSYILTFCFIGISYFFRREKNLYKLLFFYGVTFLFLAYGYTIRTALVIYIIYIIVDLFTKNKLIRESIVLVLLFGFIFSLIFLLFLNFDVNSFSSGRLTMYEEKIELIKTFNIQDILFGRGYGSDLINTDLWAGRRGSHNDFLTFFVENGLFYLLVFILLIVSLIPIKKRMNIVYLAFASAYIFSSLISNGIAVRPLPAYLYFLVLSYIYIDCFIVNTKAKGNINRI